jgi:hypothetical protein
LENQAGRSTNSISLNGRLTVCARISTKPRFFRTNTVWPRRNIQGVRWDAWVCGELQIVALPQPAKSGDHLVSVKHVNQSAQQTLIIVWPRLQIFLEDASGIADGLKHQFLVGHSVISAADKRAL